MQSRYLRKLLRENPDAGQRYLSKIKLIKDLDPFTLSSVDLDYSVNSVPPVTFPDIFSYLVLTHSFYSHQQMKAYTSLDAHKYFSAGFVLNVGSKCVNMFYVIIGKVKHSQKGNAKPLNAWCIIMKDGTVLNSHCTCIAGNSDICSHIATLLFTAEYANRNKVTISCTDMAPVWPMPSLSTVVPIVPIANMEFGSATIIIPSTKHVPSLSKEGVANLLNRIEGLGRKASIMRIVEPFSSKLQADFNIVLPDVFSVFDEKHTSKTYIELMEVSRAVNISLTKEQVSLIEHHTRQQHASIKWYEQRAGRITASKLKSVCKTNKESPSISLIKSICYPAKVLFQTKATEWGLEHKSSAIQQYQKQMDESHENFVINDVGLMIDPRWPQLGASPDKIVCCECCLKGVLEVKCPYLLYVNDVKLISEYVEFKNSCLTLGANGITLKRDHSYYYQIQMQIFVSNLLYCDFVIWSPKIFFTERILPDPDFWKQNLQIALKFHAEVIMPEFLGRYFSRQEGSAKLTYWCKCKSVDDGTPMICCDNEDCQIKWFHFKCVNLSVDNPSSSQWFCDTCQPK